MENVRDVVKAKGWVLARDKKHEIWKCPCPGSPHQLTIGKTPGDFRSPANQFRDLRRTGCPSLVEEVEPETNVPVDAICHICHAELKAETFDEDWHTHEGISCCRHHDGIVKWHREQSRKERATAS